MSYIRDTKGLTIMQANSPCNVTPCIWGPMHVRWVAVCLEHLPAYSKLLQNSWISCLAVKVIVSLSSPGLNCVSIVSTI
jgi:hypothetical protein